jgi:hypothetical protein
MVWNPEDDSPPVKAFRDLISEWLKSGQLWTRNTLPQNVSAKV